MKAPLIGSQPVVNRYDWRRAVLRSRLLPAGTKVAALALCEFVNGDSGTAFPSYSTLADAGGMEPEGVRSAIKRLSDAGFLSVRKRGFGGTNGMTLMLPVEDTGSSNPGRPARNATNPVPPQRIEGSNPGSPARIEGPNPVPPQRSIRAGRNGQSGATATVNLYSNQNSNPALPEPRAMLGEATAAEAPSRGPRESGRDFSRRTIAWAAHQRGLARKVGMGRQDE